MRRTSQPARRAFALREAVTLVSLAAVGLALFTPIAAQGAGQSRLQVCMGRLKDIAKSSAMFANDHVNLIASERGAAGTVRWRSLGSITYPDTGLGQDAAARDQAVDIIRVRGSRTDIERIGTAWVPNPAYTHLVLADYNGEELPSPQYACPEDANLLAWQSDPTNFNNLGVPCPAPPGKLANADKRWPYMSSYTVSTHVWSHDDPYDVIDHRVSVFDSALVIRTSGTHREGATDHGNRRYDEVAFPSAKVHFADRGARHFTPRPVYTGLPEAKHPVLYFDGVVRTTRTGGMNPGWDPRRAGPLYTYSYIFNNSSPFFDWFPGFADGSRGAVALNAAFWQCTRDGLAGLDLPPPR